MDTTPVNAIRKLGWQYGNAAILCYLSSHGNAAIKFVEQHKDVLVSDLIVQHNIITLRSRNTCHIW